MVVPFIGPAIEAGREILGIGNKIIDRLWPDPLEREKAKLALAQMAQNGEFRDQELRIMAIMAEAKSEDPWTSRARPSFFYVVYLLLLTAIPFGILAMFKPDSADDFARGVKFWFDAVPEIIWQVFIAGFLGYGAMRTVEKVKGVQ